jgi:hypothetical protein
VELCVAQQRLELVRKPCEERQSSACCCGTIAC